VHRDDPGDFAAATSSMISPQSFGEPASTAITSRSNAGLSSLSYV